MPAHSWRPWPVILWDRLYRVWHRLDHPVAAVPPLLCLAVRDACRAIRLQDGVVIASGEPIADLHLDNRQVRALHHPGLTPVALGLTFRRQFRASLRTLARRARPGEPFAHLKAFAAVTIFHEGLERLGFEADDCPLRWPRVVALYQRALLFRLHPSGRLAVHRQAVPAARRWITRDRLLARYGQAMDEVA